MNDMKDNSPKSDHFGEQGGRGRWHLRVTGINSFEGQFGQTYLYRFVTPGGNVAVWRSGTDAKVTRGDDLVVVGTVKQHGEYRGTKQTVLTRCSLYRADEVGTCPSCGGTVLQCDIGKNCPTCKKRGLKVADFWFHRDELDVQTEAEKLKAEVDKSWKEVFGEDRPTDVEEIAF